LCKKACGLDIEVDHIKPVAAGGTNAIDNAIPLCYKCHAKVHHYNDLHPRGTKYWNEELKIRREQVYEEFTRHLVPPIYYTVTQDLGNNQKRVLPDVGFLLQHLGDSLPVHVIVGLKILWNGKKLAPPKGHYDKSKRWRLNPRMLVMGHFNLPTMRTRSIVRLEVEAAVTIVDRYDRHHELLPVGWVYTPAAKSWYLEP
jgi:hypothetical protein